MARTSTISKHPKRKEIDKALVAPGASIRGIARTFRVSEDALSRYVKGGNIEQKVAKAQQAQDIVEADDLLKEVQETENITRHLISTSVKKTIKTLKGEDIKNPDYDPRLAVKLIARREKQIELKGRVLGSFKDPAQGKGGNTPGGIGSTVVVYVPDNGRKTGK